MTNLEFDKIKEKLAYIAGPDSNDNLIIDYNDAIEYIKLFVDSYDKLIIEELTKVKAVIASMPNDNPSYWNKCDVVDRKAIFDLLDKRISKLEGKDIKEEFVEFCKGNGLEVEFVDSDKPDTFETFFGNIHMSKSEGDKGE